MARKAEHLDEDDIRVRPGRGKSRPRSKERPEHADAQPGTVITVDRGRFTIELDDLSIRTAAAFIAEEPNYSRLAARLLSTVIDKEVQKQVAQQQNNPPRS